MHLPKPVSSVLYELLQGAVEGLTEKLGATTGDLANPKEQASSAPGLPSKIQADPRYQQATVAYWQRQADREQQLKTNDTERARQLKAQDLAEQRDLSKLRRDLIRESQFDKIALQMKEMETLGGADSWFAGVSRTETEQILQRAQQQHRLLILVGPPQIGEECPASFHNHLILQISNQVNSFLGQHYPYNSPLYPVEFYGDYFHDPIADNHVQQLASLLGSVPTGVLYSDINDDEVIFHVGFWGVTDSPVARFSLPGWNWEQTKNTLQAAGYSKRDAHQAIASIMVTVHKLLAAFVADWYYLNIDPYYEPQLFGLESEFLEQRWCEPYIDSLRQMQKVQRSAYQLEVQQLAEEAFEKLKAQNNWRSTRTLTGYLDFVHAVAISPDSQTLVCGLRDKNIKTWQLKPGNLLRTLTGHSLPVMTVAISSDGGIIVSGGRDNSIKIWELKTGDLLRNLKGHSDWVCAVAITPDGETLISGSRDKTLKIWELSSGKVIGNLKGHLRQIDTVEICPKGEKVVSSGYDKLINIWQLRTGKLLHSIEGHLDRVQSVAISPDGEILVSGSSDRTIKIWELRTGHLIRTLTGHVREVNSVAISPDGQIIASGGSDKTIKIWELPTGKLIGTLTGHSDMVSCLAISPDGQKIVSGSGDKTMRIWQCN